MFDKLEEYFATLKVDKSVHTVRSYLNILNRFVEYFHIESIDDINKIGAKEIQDYLNLLATQHINSDTTKEKIDSAKSTANGHARVIKVFLNWLEAKKYIIATPFTKDIKKFKEAKTDKEFYNEEERDQIILACKKKLWLQVTMALLFYTGLRREEAVNLKISDFYGDHILATRKNNKQQKLYFPPFVGKLIDKYLSKRKDSCEYLLVSIRGQHQISDVSLGLRVKEACRLAGIEDERIKKTGAHTIRRSFACILLLNGSSSFTIQQALGHSSPLVTERYVKPAMDLIAGKAMTKQNSPSWYDDNESE